MRAQARPPASEGSIRRPRPGIANATHAATKARRRGAEPNPAPIRLESGTDGGFPPGDDAGRCVAGAIARVRLRSDRAATALGRSGRCVAAPGALWPGSGFEARATGRCRSCGAGFVFAGGRVLSVEGRALVTRLTIGVSRTVVTSVVAVESAAVRTSFTVPVTASALGTVGAGPIAGGAAGSGMPGPAACAAGAQASPPASSGTVTAPQTTSREDRIPNTPPSLRRSEHERRSGA